VLLDQPFDFQKCWEQKPFILEKRLVKVIRHDESTLTCTFLIGSVRPIPRQFLSICSQSCSPSVPFNMSKIDAKAARFAKPIEYEYSHADVTLRNRDLGVFHKLPPRFLDASTCPAQRHQPLPILLSYVDNCSSSPSIRWRASQLVGPDLHSSHRWLIASSKGLVDENNLYEWEVLVIGCVNHFVVLHRDASL
jgi:hypothetical protein